MTERGLRRVFGRVAAGVTAIAIPLCAMGSVQAAGLIARGNEPGWRLEITDDAMSFTTMDGTTVSAQPVPAAVSGNEMTVYSSAVDGAAFVVVVADKICTDTMSGMPFPKTVAVVSGDQSVTGCGGESVGLLLGEWRVEEIGGQPVVAGSEASISFDLDGRVYGNSSCNRFFGSFELTGEGLTISDTGGTMMACDDDLMQQEQRFLAALETVGRFESLPDGQLRLVGQDGRPAVSARR